MKIAKVITTSFVPRVLRQKSQICGEPPGYFSHSQNFVTCESVIDLIKMNVNMEEMCDPGEDVDLIIINNDSGFELGRQYLDSLDGKLLKRGKIRIFHRENYGRSFGGYSYAFMKLRKEYDYFIFTEDDIIVWRDGYASKGLEIMNNHAQCGFVAYQGISRKYKKNNLNDSIHAHGGVGLSSTIVLNKVVDWYGFLPHATSNSSQRYEEIIEKGEVAFTNVISKLGFEVLEISQKTKFYDFAYDLMRNISKPRYIKGFSLILYRVILILKNIK
jgi:hypothetical protein